MRFRAFVLSGTFMSSTAMLIVCSLLWGSRANAQTAPHISSFTPASGTIGTTVTITGTGFTGATRVAFNRVAASFSVDSDTQITATVPAGATTGTISVTTPSGTGWSFSGTPFTVDSAGAPTISSFSPGSGSVGWTVTLTGTNFSGTTGVSFNGTPATTMWGVSDTQFDAKVPSGATSGPITLTNSLGSAVSATSFTVTPHISSFTPSSGPVGTTVTISGTSFTGAEAVTFFRVAASFTVDSDTQITATAPSGAQSGWISVKTAQGTAWSSGNFTVGPTAPPPTGLFGHVAIVMEENTNYSSVTSSSMPYLFGLMTQYGLATQYYSDLHSSIGNYFVLTTGQTITSNDSATPSSFPVSADNVVRELVAAGKTWKAYAESLPSVGYLGGDTTSGGGQYYVRHVPVAYFMDVQNSSAQQQNLVPFTQFAQDLTAGTLPNYSFITPNGCDDAHDCSLSTADSWLQNNIDPLIKNPVFQKDGLLIVVFDESANDNTNGGGRVVCTLISPTFSKPGYQSSSFYQHESVLRLMLEGLGVTVLPGAASTAPDMGEFFNP